MTRRDALLALASTLPVAGAESKPKGSGQVRLERLPNGGIQPQVIADKNGAVHVLHYGGDPFHGDVLYRRSADGGETFSSALRVNSPGSAIAAGTIRGAQMAIGRHGTVHVVWNGSANSALKGPINPESGKPGSPMLYSRLNDAKTGFEPERNLMHRSFGLDGGGSVAADEAGNIYVVWHGINTDLKSVIGAEGEARRQVWLTKSDDNGKSFHPEAPAWQEPTGACGCCGTKVFASQDGSVHMLYRSATKAIHRDIYLITSADRGKSFHGGLLHKWDINACPMSSMDFAENSGLLIGAWETGGEVYWTRITTDRPEALEPVRAPGGAKGRKHPRLAVNDKGELLFVWTEGTGWQRGGSVAWQQYDHSGRATSEHGSVGGLPAWSFAAPVANTDGTFSIFF